MQSVLVLCLANTIRRVSAKLDHDVLIFMCTDFALVS